MSIGVVHDWSEMPGNEVAKVDTKKNGADLMTKPLGFVLHWRHADRIGMKFLEEGASLEYFVELDDDWGDEYSPGKSLDCELAFTEVDVGVPASTHT